MSERGKRHRVFMYGEISPGEIEHLLQSRRIIFEAAYVSGWERVFRCDPSKSSNGLATLRTREKAVTFGFYFNALASEIDAVDSLMGVDKGIRSKQSVMMGYGDGEIGPATAYVTRYKNFGWPPEATLRKMADWINRFWPQEDTKTSWRDISIR